MLRLVGAARLVADEIDVELRQADDPQAGFFEHAVEHAGIVGREQMQRAIALVRRPQSERGGDGCGIALEVAVQTGEP